MKNKHLYYLVGLIIIGLIAVQISWIYNSIKLQKIAAERLLEEDLSQVVTELEERTYSFSFYSKALLKGEGMYIIRQKYGKSGFISPADGGNIDTLDLFNVFYENKKTKFIKDKTIAFGQSPVKLDVLLKFTFASPVSSRRQADTALYNLSHVTQQNFKEALANNFNANEALDVSYMDYLIRSALKKNMLDTVYEAGIRKQGASSFDYLSPNADTAHLTHSAISAVFLKNRFDKPYELLLYVPDAFNTAMRSMSRMMIASITIIILLILSYAYFVRTIFNQKKLSDMKNTFINNITHEFRTPITNINLAVDNWRESAGTDNFYAKVICEENAHMERNVEQILQIAMLEQGKMKTNFSKVNIQALLHEIVNSFEMQLNKTNGIVFYNTKATDIYVTGDRQQLKNLFHNLIDNAIKYKRQRPEITISVRKIHDDVEVEIEDNGIGMPAEVQKNIFKQFYRGYSGDKHDVKGFGLGLNYVKHIIEAHKGSIKVKSRPGKGTSFTVILPGG